MPETGSLEPKNKEGEKMKNDGTWMCVGLTYARFVGGVWETHPGGVACDALGVNPRPEQEDLQTCLDNEVQTGSLFPLTKPKRKVYI